MTAYEIPTSRLKCTHYNPAVASGPDAMQQITGKTIEPANWVEDFQQVTAGTGSIGFSRRITDGEQHPCPACGSSTSRKLTHEPNCAYWGQDHSCECGADYTSEDIGWDHARASILEAITEQTKADFAYWWERSAPAGSQALYEEDRTMLSAVRLPDGRIVRRG